MKTEQQQLESISNFLSLVLRHAPETIGLELDEQGWTSIAVLLKQARRHRKRLSADALHDIVAINDKARFAISPDGLLIRANQAHSAPTIDLGLPASAPPPSLYHGTASRFIDSLRKTGLASQSRNHVHLSAARETAAAMGKRHGSPVVLTVRSGAMHEQGRRFYLSENGVWLTEQVPLGFIEFP